jgi:hypothetical protein
VNVKICCEYKETTEQYFVGLEVPMAATVKSTIFWNVTPCSLVEVFRLHGITSQKSNTPENSKHHTENCKCHSDLVPVDPWLTSPCALREKEKPQNVHSGITALRLNPSDL